jgi:hypothetical protein
VQYPNRPRGFGGGGVGKQLVGIREEMDEFLQESGQCVWLHMRFVWFHLFYFVNQKINSCGAVHRTNYKQ